MGGKTILRRNPYKLGKKMTGELEKKNINMITKLRKIV